MNKKKGISLGPQLIVILIILVVLLFLIIVFLVPNWVDLKSYLTGIKEKTLPNLDELGLDARRNLARSDPLVYMNSLKAKCLADDVESCRRYIDICAGKGDPKNEHSVSVVERLRREDCSKKDVDEVREFLKGKQEELSGRIEERANNLFYTYLDLRREGIGGETIILDQLRKEYAESDALRAADILNLESNVEFSTEINKLLNEALAEATRNDYSKLLLVGEIYRTRGLADDLLAAGSAFERIIQGYESKSIRKDEIYVRALINLALLDPSNSVNGVIVVKRKLEVDDLEKLIKGTISEKLLDDLKEEVEKISEEGSATSLLVKLRLEEERGISVILDPESKRISLGRSVDFETEFVVLPGLDSSVINDLLSENQIPVNLILNIFAVSESEGSEDECIFFMENTINDPLSFVDGKSIYCSNFEILVKELNTVDEGGYKLLAQVAWNP